MNCNKIFVTFFGVGNIKKAPGTFGSLAGLLFWLLINFIFFDVYTKYFLQNNIFWLSFVIITTFYACNSITKYGKQVGEIDHKSVVIDEVVGIVIALQIVYFCGFYQYRKIVALFLSFTFFRLFDITKPAIIGWCDKNLKTGFGVMLDDILAGIFAGISTLIIMFLSLDNFRF
jgi:phosphatidylglycerophosphatase A